MGWIQNFADLPRAMRALKGSRRLAPGLSRGPLLWVAGTAKLAKDEEFAVMFAACGLRTVQLGGRASHLPASGIRHTQLALQAWKILLDGDEIHGRQDVLDTP